MHLEEGLRNIVSKDDSPLCNKIIYEKKYFDNLIDKGGNIVLSTPDSKFYTNFK